MARTPTDNTIRIGVAKTLVQMREGRQLTQTELASAAGVDRKTVNRIERGHYSPSMDTLYRLCVALDTTLARFVKNLG